MSCATRVAVSKWPSPLRFAPRRRLPSAASAEPSLSRGVDQRFSTDSVSAGSDLSRTRYMTDFDGGSYCSVFGLNHAPNDLSSVWFSARANYAAPIPVSKPARRAVMTIAKTDSIVCLRHRGREQACACPPAQIPACALTHGAPTSDDDERPLVRPRALKPVAVSRETPTQGRHRKCVLHYLSRQCRVVVSTDRLGVDPQRSQSAWGSRPAGPAALGM